MLFDMWCSICEDSTMSPVHIILEHLEGPKTLYGYFISDPDGKLQLAIAPFNEDVPDTYTRIARLFETDVAKVAAVCSNLRLARRTKSPKAWVDKIVVRLCGRDLVISEAELLWRHLLGAE